MNINVDLPDHTPEDVAKYLESWAIPPDSFKVTHFRERFTVVILDGKYRVDIVTKLGILEDSYEQGRR